MFLLDVFLRDGFLRDGFLRDGLTGASLRRQFGEDVAEPVEPVPPERLEDLELLAGVPQCRDVGADEVLPALPALDHQPGPLENGDVLLDRREADWVVAGELEDALLGADRAADNVAARVIRESGEEAVERTQAASSHEGVSVW